MDNEEKVLEQEALSVAKEEEVRAKIISDFGFDETVDAERIDKLVAYDMGNRKKLSTAINQKIKHRTEAETLRNTVKPPVTTDAKPVENKGNMSMKDALAIMEAKVHADDIAEVEDFARYKGISIAEALKNSTIKTLLSEKAEQRNIAEATNTGTARRSVSKPSDAEILTRAYEGKLPDDPAALAVARINEKRARK